MTPDEPERHASSVPALPLNYTRLDMHRDFSQVFSTPEGKRVLGHLFAFCDLWAASAIMEGMTGSESALVHEGKRIVGLRLMEHMRHPRETEIDMKVGYGGRNI